MKRQFSDHFYTIGRFFIEIIREDYAREFVYDGLLSLSQFISIIIGAVALFIYFYILKNNEQQLRLSIRKVNVGQMKN